MLPRQRRAEDEAGADVSRAELQQRRARGRLAQHPQLPHQPGLPGPGAVFPLFFFIAFAGGLSAVGNVPGFDFPSGYTAFQFVFVLLQSAAFGGVFTGFGIARDFETGFAPPLPARRPAPQRDRRRLRARRPHPRARHLDRADRRSR